MSLTFLLFSVVILNAAPYPATAEAPKPQTQTEAPQTAQATEQETTPPAAEARLPDNENVLMMSFLVSESLHQGRVLYESEDAVVLEKLGGGSMRYRKELLTDVRRYVFPLQAYWEEVGDYYMDGIWERKDDLSNYYKARSAYLKSLGYEDTQAVSEKLNRIETERDHLQRELIKLHEVAKAKHEAEKARLEKERADAELNALPELARMVNEHARQLRDVGQALRDIARRMKDIKDDIDDLEDKVQDLSRRTRIVIHLRRDYDSLKQAIDRLEKLPEKAK